MEFLPSTEFRHCVERYNGNYKLQSFSCWDQFLCMAFAQLTYRESLRDIEACLRSAGSKLYHMGFRGRVSRNTLAHANSVRDWRIYADFAQALIPTARQLYAEDSNLDRDFRLRACRHRQKASRRQGQSLQNSSDCQRHYFRKNTAFTGPFNHRFPRFRFSHPQSTESIQLTLGQ